MSICKLRSSYSVKFVPVRSISKKLNLRAYSEFGIWGGVCHAENDVLAHFKIFLCDCAITHIKNTVNWINLGFSVKSHACQNVNFPFQVNQLTTTDCEVKAISSCIKLDWYCQLFVCFSVRVTPIILLVCWRM